jgi:hypothetical protein
MENTCISCEHWKPVDDSWEPVDGICEKLSGDEYTEGKVTYRHDPASEITGIEGVPECAHDGAAVTYTTKNWFGCVHYSKK